MFWYDPATETYYDEQGYEIDDGSNGVMNPEFSSAGKVFDPEFGLWYDMSNNKAYNVRGYELVEGDDST
jgi:hypothetical protein